MKKVYEKPEFSVVKFETEDIVRTSDFLASKKFNNIGLNELLSMDESK